MKNRAQTILEYTIFISVVTVALFYMGPAIKRGLQSLIKTTADQIGNQENADQDVNKPITNGDLAGNVDNNELITAAAVPKAYDGYLVESTSTTKAKTNRVTRESNYATTVTVRDETKMMTNSVTDMGFTKR